MKRINSDLWGVGSFAPQECPTVYSVHTLWLMFAYRKHNRQGKRGTYSQLAQLQIGEQALIHRAISWKKSSGCTVEMIQSLLTAFIWLHLTINTSTNYKCTRTKPQTEGHFKIGSQSHEEQRAPAVRKFKLSPVLTVLWITFIKWRFMHDWIKTGRMTYPWPFDINKDGRLVSTSSHCAKI